jgi:hypothetical protein
MSGIKEAKMNSREAVKIAIFETVLRHHVTEEENEGIRSG